MNYQLIKISSIVVALVALPAFAMEKEKPSQSWQEWLLGTPIKKSNSDNGELYFRLLPQDLHQHMIKYLVTPQIEKTSLFNFTTQKKTKSILCSQASDAVLNYLKIIKQENSPTLNKMAYNELLDICASGKISPSIHYFDQQSKEMWQIIKAQINQAVLPQNNDEKELQEHNKIHEELREFILATCKELAINPAFFTKQHDHYLALIAHLYHKEEERKEMKALKFKSKQQRFEKELDGMFRKISDPREQQENEAQKIDLLLSCLIIFKKGNRSLASLQKKLRDICDILATHRENKKNDELDDLMRSIKEDHLLSSIANYIKEKSYYILELLPFNIKNDMEIS
jgi:hypothetical protein